MSTRDKLKNLAQKAKGKGRKGVGDLTGNESMRAHGDLQERGADAKQAGEKVKDALNNEK